MSWIDKEIAGYLLQERECGELVVNGAYFISPKYSMPCDRLPLPLPVFMCKDHGVEIKLLFQRALQRIDPLVLFGEHNETSKCINTQSFTCNCSVGKDCFVCFPPPIEYEVDGEEYKVSHFIDWVGDKHYPQDKVVKEAGRIGISRRVPAKLMKGFVPRQSVVYLVKDKYLDVVKHNDNGYEVDSETKQLKKAKVACVVLAYKPLAVIYTVTERQAQDLAFMKNLREKGFTPIILPNSHPSVKYERPKKPHKHLRNKEKVKDKTKDLRDLDAQFESKLKEIARNYLGTSIEYIKQNEATGMYYYINVSTDKTKISQPITEIKAKELIEKFGEESNDVDRI